MRTILFCAALAACGGGSAKTQATATTTAAPEAPSNHIELAKLSIKPDGGKLVIGYELTPKKVFTGESLLVRAACTKGTDVVRDTAVWPIQENTMDPKANENPFSDQLTGATACQLDFQIVADITTMSGTHEMTACWNAGTVSTGACTPPITETYAQGVAALCALDKNVRWDTKGPDRDVELKKLVEDRVWNQQAKDLFGKLANDPEAKRVEPLKAAAKQQGVADCTLATFWSKPG